MLMQEGEQRKIMNSILEKEISELVKNTSYAECLQNKTVLITGANGLLARYLSYYLLMCNKMKDSNIHVILLARSKEKTINNFSYFEGDKNLSYLFQDVCDKINYDGEIDYIFHAASNASAYAIRNNPVDIIKSNLIGTFNVLELAHETNVTKVVFPSTREIYGKITGLDVIHEEDMGTLDPMDERNCYPESKRMAEAIFKSYSKQFQIPFNILRIAHTYGPCMPLANDGRVMSDLINFAINEEDIILNSDGTALRSFCYVSDAILGILSVMCNGEINEVYNLSNTKESVSIRELAQKIAANVPYDIKVGFKEASPEVLKGYTSYKIVNMDNSKLEALGWNPSITLDEGLRRTIQYFLEEKN